jgi:hypothetical protein
MFHELYVHVQVAYFETGLVRSKIHELPVFFPLCFLIRLGKSSQFANNMTTTENKIGDGKKNNKSKRLERLMETQKFSNLKALPVWMM